jgi:hypothetical protein
MIIGFIRFWIAPAAAYGRVARRYLQANFPDKSVQVWRSTRAWQSRLAPNRPRHGGSINHIMRYLEWSCALYRALQEHGVNQAEAAALVETVMWDVYQPVPATMFKLSRLRSAERETRVKWILGMTTRHFLAAPFCYRHLPSKAGVSFDVLACPFADYFKEQGVPELTEPAAGNLDYGMAREWGVELVRTQTIADGAAHCDFRWKFPAHGQ